MSCGTGIVTLQVAPHVARLRAIDISDEMAARAAAKVEAAGLANTQVTNTDLFDPSLPEGTFDAVLAFNVLCYLEDLPQGAEVRKNGEMIGQTSVSIAKGHWVSHENIFSVPRDYDSEFIH